MPAKLTLSHVKKAFDSEGYRLLASEYQGHETKLPFICPNGHRYSITWHYWKKGGRCGVCKDRITIEKVRTEFQKFGYQVLDKTYSPNNKIRFICPNGHRHSINWNNFLTGYRCQKCHFLRMNGVNHWNYNPNLTEEQRKARQTEPYRNWRRSVFERDQFQCIRCGVTGKNLQAHHILSYSEYPERRLDVSNGATFCESCHNLFHELHGYKGFDRQDYIWFVLT